MMQLQRHTTEMHIPIADRLAQLGAEIAIGNDKPIEAVFISSNGVAHRRPVTSMPEWSRMRMHHTIIGEPCGELESVPFRGDVKTFYLVDAREFGECISLVYMEE